MSDAAVLQDENTSWWYRKEGDTKGPVNASELRELFAKRIISASTQVWCEAFGDNWSQYDQTSAFDRKLPTPPSPPPLPSSPDASADDPKWRPIFQRFDAATEYHYEQSWQGFLFGPLYYFYLKMWRKGFVIIGLALCASLIVVCLVVFLNLPPFQKYVGLVTNGLCAAFVKRDYYRFKRFGDRMWPSLSWFDNPWAIGALILVPIFIMSFLVALSDEARSASGSARSNQTALSKAATLKPVSKAAYDPGNRTSATTNPRRQAELNCAQWLEQSYGGKVANRYDDSTVYTYKVQVNGGDIASDSVHFGGHLTMAFNAQAIKYTNGRQSDLIDLPEHVCIMNPDLEVIGAEVSFDDGLQ